MPKDLAKIAKEKSLRYFLITFTDLFGAQRAKLVPASAIGGMQKDGAGFAGFATWLDMSPADPDLFAKPDPDSLIILPWRKDVGWLAGDLWMDGKPVDHAPRNVLKKQIERCAAHDMTIKTGVECEFFLINSEGTDVADLADIQTKPCYDEQALMRRFDVISEICDAMQELGWGLTKMTMKTPMGNSK